jgi:Iron-containing redox enzyme
VSRSSPAAESGVRPEPTSVPLRRKIGLAMGPLTVVSERFIAHPRVAEIYPEYLVAVFQVMRGIGGVMETARQQATAMVGVDPVAEELAAYLEKHIEEERGHDAWILEDLDALGVDSDGIEERLSVPAVAELVGAQYYWALHAHPVAVLGYLAVAEGGASTPGTVRRLQEATGHPIAAFRTLIEHADLDPTHGDEVYELIDALPLTRELERLLTISALSTGGLMARALEEVLDGAPPD